jgi:threonine/homoserine efflux transporter RhtA
MAYDQNEFLLGNKKQSLCWALYIWYGNKIGSQIKKRGTVTPLMNLVTTKNSPLNYTS